MEPFPYYTRTGSQGQITTGPAYRGTKTEAETYAEVQARLGTQALTVPLVITTLHQVILEWCQQGWKVEPLAGRFGYLFTCGGSFESTDFQPTFDALNISPSIYLGDTARMQLETTFTAEAQGHQGRVVPVIQRVTDNWTGQADHYTAGKSVLIELANRKGNFSFDHTQGSKVTFRKTDGTTVEASDYGAPGKTRITAQVPAGTTGALAVLVTMTINGALRTGEYPTPLA